MCLSKSSDFYRTFIRSDCTLDSNLASYLLNGNTTTNANGDHNQETLIAVNVAANEV